MSCEQGDVVRWWFPEDHPSIPYRADIRKQPEFRAQFYAMCVSIGVDPLASNKGIWNKLLGLGGEPLVPGLRS